jgi:hypothetical protein
MTTISISPIRKFQIARREYTLAIDTAYDEFVANSSTDLKEVATNIYYEQTQIALKLYKHALKEYYEQKQGRTMA